MKKIFSILSIATALLFASCSKDNPWDIDSGEGQLSLKQMSVEVVNAEQRRGCQLMAICRNA